MVWTLVFLIFSSSPSADPVVWETDLRFQSAEECSNAGVKAIGEMTKGRKSVYGVEVISGIINSGRVDWVCLPKNR